MTELTADTLVWLRDQFKVDHAHRHAYVFQGDVIVARMLVKAADERAGRFAEACRQRYGKQGRALIAACQMELCLQGEWVDVGLFRDSVTEEWYALD